MKNLHFCIKPDGGIPERVLSHISKYLKENEGRWVNIDLSPSHPKRSSKQNGYYWAVVVESLMAAIADEWGEFISKDDAHAMLKLHCNFKGFVREDNEVLNIPQSTATLDTAEFENYLERCRRFVFTWFNFTIPLPNE